MRMQPIQFGFQSGELTPRLFGNSETKDYAKGVAECHNMIPLAQGPLASRRGSRYFGDAASDVAVRLIPFSVSREKSFVFEFTPLQLRIYNGDGLVNIGGQQLIIDRDFSQEFTFWNNESGNNGIITFNHSIGSVSLIRGGGGGGREAIIDQNLSAIEAANLNQSHTFSGQYTGDGELFIRIGTTKDDNDVANVIINTVGVFSFTVTPTTSDLWLTFENDDTNDSVATVFDLSFDLTAKNTTVATPYAAEQLPFLQYERNSTTNSMVVVHEMHPPSEIIQSGETTFIFSAITILNQPTNWVANNYPNVVTIFQGRLWLARTPDTLQGIWASKSGAYYDFDLGTGLADEALFVELAFSGEIEWMRGQKDLLLGSDLGEYRISADNGLITAGDIDIRQQSAYGSAKLIQSQNIGDQVLYVSPDGLKVRALTFDSFQQGWYSPDLTWIAQHITKSGIKEIHFARDPNTLIGCVLNDGTMAICTYDRSQESLGWAKYDFGQSTIESASVHTLPEGSVLMVALKQANGKMVIVSSPLETQTKPNMDSAIYRTVLTGNVVDGLEHLEGMTVTIKVDGAVHPDKVVTGGQITLDYDGTTAIVGLGFTVRFKTLPLNLATRAGTSANDLKHWSKIFIRVIDSYIPKINGIRNPTRRPSTPMNEPEGTIIDDLKVVTLGRTRLATITVEQDLPLDLIVLNIFGVEGQGAV